MPKKYSKRVLRAGNVHNMCLKQALLGYMYLHKIKNIFTVKLKSR